MYGDKVLSTTKDKNAVLRNTRPHYTNPTFKHAQTIFGESEDHLDYVYSDRMVQWDYDKARESEKIANESDAKKDTAQWFENYLSAYYGEKVELKHILAGYNVATGYDYRVYGFKPISQTGIK